MPVLQCRSGKFLGGPGSVRAPVALQTVRWRFRRVPRLLRERSHDGSRLPDGFRAAKATGEPFLGHDQRRAGEHRLRPLDSPLVPCVPVRPPAPLPRRRPRQRPRLHVPDLQQTTTTTRSPDTGAPAVTDTAPPLKWIGFRLQPTESRIGKRVKESQSAFGATAVQKGAPVKPG